MHFQVLLEVAIGTYSLHQMDKLNHMVMVGVQILSGNWGDAVQHDVSLEPGLWSLSNFGEVLVATIANGKTFTWNGSFNTTRSKSINNYIWF